MAKKKSSAKKAGAKKKATKKSAKKAVAAVAAVAAPGECLSLGRAGIIVQDAIPGGPHPIDLTLEQVGLVTQNQRIVFRDHVFDGVLEGGCHIDRDDIPSDGDNTIREVRDTIADAAS